jgi:glutathione synthase/RimK-type ligase-like ATP-grasp enzyme
MANILILSAKIDAHVSFVTRHLKKGEFLRIDPLDMIKGASLDYSFNGTSMDVLYKGKTLKGITSVWYRRPTPMRQDNLPVKKKFQAYAASSLQRHALALVHLFPNAFWISNVTAIRRTESKPLQMNYAARLGFNVPATLFASNPATARRFVEKHKFCVAKTLAVDFPEFQLSFTKVITPETNLKYEGLRVDPYIFQELIDPAVELRVTVVGDKVFAATVAGKETDTESEFRDWRYAHVNDSFKAEVYALPRALSQKCVKLVKELGLAFGAIDLIVDKNNKVWFLEINANGQWAFVEEATGQPIGKAMADLLRSGGQTGATRQGRSSPGPAP